MSLDHSLYHSGGCRGWWDCGGWRGPSAASAAAGASRGELKPDLDQDNGHQGQRQDSVVPGHPRGVDLQLVEANMRRGGHGKDGLILWLNFGDICLDELKSKCNWLKPLRWYLAYPLFQSCFNLFLFDRMFVWKKEQSGHSCLVHLLNKFVVLYEINKNVLSMITIKDITNLPNDHTYEEMTRWGPRYEWTWKLPSSHRWEQSCRHAYYFLSLNYLQYLLMTYEYEVFHGICSMH